MHQSNYRSIALTSCITKVYDIIIINKYHNHLDTSSLQFSVKTNHSTMMCNLTLKIIVTYYINTGSKVYPCFLDTSKAFDRIHYVKLFTILIDRKMPSVKVRSMLDMYLIWAESMIKPLFKGGNPFDPSDYRGISLTSCLGKLFCSILNIRLVNFLETNKIYTPTKLSSEETLEPVIIYLSYKPL